jgi:7-cyano-7-deazaguanine synthase
MSRLSRVVVPVSGGMDSSVLLHYAVKIYSHTDAISFNYDQKHKKELKCAKLQIDSVREKYGTKKTNHTIVPISFFKDIARTSALTNKKIKVAYAKNVMGDPQTVNYVPFRNIMLLSICLAYAESNNAAKIIHGAAQADSVAGYWDGSPEFLDKINELSSLNRRTKIEVIAPLLTKSKADIVKTGISLGVDFSKTWTCYEGKNIACGKCTACSLRIKGFLDAGYIDPLPYKIEIPWEKNNCKKINI